MGVTALYLILGLVFALVVAIFAVQNAQVVPISFFNWTFGAPLSLVILGMAAAGAVLAGLAGLIKQVGLGFRLRNIRAEQARTEGERKRLEEQVKALQAEVTGLRARNGQLEEGIKPPAEEAGQAGL